MKYNPLFHRPARRVLFDGDWLTAPEIAKRLGVSERTMHRRMQLGLPLSKGRRRGPTPKLYEFRGGLATAEEIAKATGYARATVQRRSDNVRFYERGEEIGLAEPIHNSRIVFFQGVSDTVSGWGRRTGLNRYTIADRLRAGWPVEKALTHKPLARQTITFDGITDTVGKWAERVGMSMSTLRNRLAAGWTVEEALKAKPTNIGQRQKRKAQVSRLIDGFHGQSASPDPIPATPSASAKPPGGGLRLPKITPRPAPTG